MQPNVFRLDRVGARLEIIAVDRFDDIRAGVIEDLVAALELVEVIETEVGVLQPGADSTVTHDDAPLEHVEQVGVVDAIVHISHRYRVVGLPKSARVAMPLLPATQGLRWPGDTVGCERPSAVRPAQIDRHHRRRRLRGLERRR